MSRARRRAGVRRGRWRLPRGSRRARRAPHVVSRRRRPRCRRRWRRAARPASPPIHPTIPARVAGGGGWNGGHMAARRRPARTSQRRAKAATMVSELMRANFRRRDNRPRANSRRTAIIRRPRPVVVPPLAVAPVLSVIFSACMPRSAALAPQLLRLADLEPELVHHDTVFHEPLSNSLIRGRPGSTRAGQTSTRSTKSAHTTAIENRASPRLGGARNARDNAAPALRRSGPQPTTVWPRSRACVTAGWRCPARGVPTFKASTIERRGRPGEFAERRLLPSWRLIPRREARRIHGRGSSFSRSGRLPARRGGRLRRRRRHPTGRAGPRAAVRPP